jgi:twitching motility two-component system response regulator PilH
LARKILLADDSVTAQNMGRRILNDAGYEVTTVNNGSAALKKVAESKPDLIVLDVYMPGYGGLEVCQRLRESEDTARIPVLLTVGKLEPFKVEEVRRVRADAFIIKPFEASELLTALTKLEDKIVPQPQPRKPGRFPKPGGGLDDLSGSGRQYGDTETGWKNRLRIPPPHRKGQPESSEPEVQPEQQRAANSESQAQEIQAQASVGLPPDITADEIAAIQAAAAAFNTPEDLAVKPTAEPGPSDENAPEAAPAQLSASVESAAEVPSTLPPLPTTSSEESTATAPPYASIESSETKDLPATAESHSSPAPEELVAEPGRLAEHEVAAVLASLQAVTGAADMTQEPDEPFFATIAAATSSPEYSGPRWIAASVPLGDEESSLILEQEMQKALAAMAAVDAVSSAQSSEALAVGLGAAATSTPEVELGMAAASAGESPATQTPEPPVPSISHTEEHIPPLADAVAPCPEPAAMQPAVQEQAAYAAAASTGSVTGEVGPSVEAASPALAGDSQPPAVAPEPPQPESELAAAWANWKQIRESVVSPELASQIADAASVAPAALDQPETAAVERAAVESSADDSTDESAAIAGIVDTVLAELKPKLMQEIARKMAKPKKPK